MKVKSNDVARHTKILSFSYRPGPISGYFTIAMSKAYKQLKSKVPYGNSNFFSGDFSNTINAKA